MNKKKPTATTADLIFYDHMRTVNKRLLEKMFRKYLKKKFDPVFDRMAETMAENYFADSEMIFWEKPNKHEEHTVGITMRKKAFL